jgi:RHH-type proline utilization regulon transcriptional repressor/proline dehydrogenase/delta 1-pyrroline-5-carboxylate dehydrogenase
MSAISHAVAGPVDPVAILSPELPAVPSPLRQAITAAWMRDEAEHVRELLDQARLPDTAQAQVQALAADLVGRVRTRARNQGAIEAFMRQYDLGSEEGVLLMCVAEALLRIPDQDTADKLIRDKLGDADWKRHMGESDSVLVNASTWGLMLTGRLVQLNDLTRHDVRGAFKRLVGRVGEPVIRLAVRQAMRIMGHQFVMGRNIGEALSRSRKGDNADYRYSFDMLGEGALTAHDAARYLQAYRKAIQAIGASVAGDPRSGAGRVFAAPSISIKLSALHPRYEHAKRARVMAELAPRILELAQLAKAQGIGFTIDAEEADRLELSLDLIEATFPDASLDGWEGYGLAVQAYQKRTPYVIDFLADLARRAGRRMPVRLVKGAYWDAEIKRAQVEGHPGYPVFTRKPNTDVSYLANARRLFDHIDALYPMFATHNAHTIAAVHALSRLSAAEGQAPAEFEFQKLHGMGDDLYAEVMPADRLGIPCRVYAPVGSHEDLLPYLVRRLLENGANSSFVNRITDEDVPVEELVSDPVRTVAGFDSIPHPRIPLPGQLFNHASATHPKADRTNSMGVNLANDQTLRTLAEQVNAAFDRTGQHGWRAAPLVPGAVLSTRGLPVTNPADRRHMVGEWHAADIATVKKALHKRGRGAAGLGPDARRGPRHHPRTRRRAAGAAHARVHRAVRQGGRQVDPDGVAEVREAVDSCATTPPRRARSSARPNACPGRPANPTSCSCTAAACSCASVPGTSRWRSSWARSAPRWRPATASSPSRPSRPT